MLFDSVLLISLYSTLKLSDTSLGRAGATVPHGSTCVFKCPGGTGISKECSAGAWNGTLNVSCSSAPCAFNDIVAVHAGAISSAPCMADAMVANGSTCSFAKSGYACDSSACSGGVWSDTAINCTADRCAFNDLVSVDPSTTAQRRFGDVGQPPNARCRSGESVTSGSICDFSRTGHTCDSTSCYAGNWSDPVITCSANPCAFVQARARGLTNITSWI